MQVVVAYNVHDTAYMVKKTSLLHQEVYRTFNNRENSKCNKYDKCVKHDYQRDKTVYFECLASLFHRSAVDCFCTTL